MNVYEITTDDSDFVEYVVYDDDSGQLPTAVLREHGYSIEGHHAERVTSDSVIEHYENLSDEMDEVFGVLEKMIRNQTQDA